MDIESLRKDISVTENLIYLDNAGVSPLPLYVENSVLNFLESRRCYGKSKIEFLVKEYTQKLRDEISKLINCKTDDIAITSNTAEGINIIAQGLKFKEGDNIILIQNEYPSNIYPWLNLQKKGVEVRFGEEVQGKVSLDSIKQLIDSRTKLIAISHVEFISGYKNDLYELSQLCKESNIDLIVDAAQSIGVIDIDVSKLYVSAICCCGWKWLLGPLGIGFLYCSSEFASKIDLTFVGCLSVAETDLINYNIEPKKDCSRFEYSSRDIGNYFGFYEAIKRINQLKPKDIEKRVYKLTDIFREGIDINKYELYYEPNGFQEMSGIVSFKSKIMNSNDVLKTLIQNNIYCIERYNYIRISPHFYNTEEEIMYLLKILNEISSGF